MTNPPLRSWHEPRSADRDPYREHDLMHIAVLKDAGLASDRAEGTRHLDAESASPHLLSRQDSRARARERIDDRTETRAAEADLVL